MGTTAITNHQVVIYNYFIRTNKGTMSGYIKALEWGCRLGYLGVVKKVFVDAGTTRLSDTALILAIANNQIEIVDLLLKKTMIDTALMTTALLTAEKYRNHSILVKLQEREKEMEIAK